MLRTHPDKTIDTNSEETLLYRRDMEITSCTMQMFYFRQSDQGSNNKYRNIGQCEGVPLHNLSWLARLSC